MALLLNDGFGLYNTTAGALAVKGWTSVNVSPSSFTTGRVSTSRLVNLVGPVGGGNHLVQTLASFAGATSIVGCAFKKTDANAALYDLVSVGVGGSAVRVAWSGANSLAVYKDSTLVATLGGTYAVNVWYYIEIKVTWAVAGQVVVRIDGSTYYDSGMTLAAPTAGLTVGLRDAFANFSAFHFADLLVMDGSGSTFNNFQGDVICETLLPNGAGASAGWTPARPAVTVNSKQLVDNVATLGMAVLSGINAGETITVAGVDATFNGTYTVTAAAVPPFTGISYAKVAANVTQVSSGGTVTSTPTNLQAVDDLAQNNGDIDYVSTATVNTIDTFAMQNLATSASSPVLAVRPIVVARKESAAVMSIAAVARSAGVNYAGAAFDLPNALTYIPIGDTLTTDPATAAAWTRAAVDAIEVGPKKVS